MILYKIIRLVGDHGTSVFPVEDQQLEPAEDLAGEPMQDLINIIIGYGYPPDTARHIINAWAHHAKYDLHQLPRGVRVFCEMCIQQLKVPIQQPGPGFWEYVIQIAVIAAVVLALYLWVTLDKDIGVTFGSHPWAYAMKYEERLWQGEVLFVSAGQEGVYEQGGELWSGSYEHRRDEAYIDRKLDRLLFYRRFVLSGRKLVFFHEYRWIYWDVYFCGVLTKISDRRYRLREPGYDPYKPRGRWLRPGGDMFTPEYEGAWQKWWWL